MSTVFNFTFVPWFRSVAPYIHMHRGKTFVVGLAGEAIAAGKGVVTHNGRMVENLHVDNARRVLAVHAAITTRQS